MRERGVWRRGGWKERDKYRDRHKGGRIDTESGTVRE